MKVFKILVILIGMCYGYEHDSTGIPIMIVNNRFDNAWSDTTRDTVVNYKKIGKLWYVFKWSTDYFLPFPQFLIFKELK